MGDYRLRILAEARNILEQEGGAETEKESLVKLLDILTASVEKTLPNADDQIQNLARELVKHQSHLEPGPARCIGCRRIRSHASDRERAGCQHFPIQEPQVILWRRAGCRRDAQPAVGKAQVWRLNSYRGT